MHCLSLENSRYDFARQTVLPFHWLRPKPADSANLIADLVSVTDPESKFGFDRMRSVPFCQRMEAAYSGPQWSILALLGKTANSFVDFVGAQSRIHEKWSSAVGTMVGSFSRVAPRFLKAICMLYRTMWLQYWQDIRSGLAWNQQNCINGCQARTLTSAKDGLTHWRAKVFLGVLVSVRIGKDRSELRVGGPVFQ